MKRFVLIVVALATLAACDKKDPALAPPCPTTVVVKELADLTTFKPGDGRDLTDVEMQAAVTGFDGFCETDFKQGEHGEVTVDLRVLFRVTRGPANTDRKGAFSYFVAIADKDNNPVQKHVFTSEVEFAGNRNRVAPFEELTLGIPLKQGENGSDYNVLIGFQLTPEQIEYNRNRSVR